MRSKKEILEKLREQAEFLRSSARGFYEGNYSESLRIALHLRTLVHEGMSKPLLKQVQPNGLDLSIIEHVGETQEAGEEVLTFAVGIRTDGPVVFPSVDLESANYTRCSIGAWWNRRVFSFWTTGAITTRMVYTRKQVILILANKEGGAHVDQKIDPAYIKLLTETPLGFECAGARIETPDLARFLAAQSGVEMLECLKRHFFSDLDVPSKWDVQPVPPVSITLDQITGLAVTTYGSTFPRPRIKITKR